jgi:16S rRNA C967 or C1407 C5-methylase (RsmB/RsmF family)
MNNSRFEDYFQKIYGPRWPEIKAGLIKSEKQVLRSNKFVKSADISDFQACSFLADCFWKPEGYPLKKNEQDLYEFYAMGPASVITAEMLAVNPGSKVLDMCAAPGGKSLILAEKLFLNKKNETQPTGELISNEMSEARRQRLMRVFHEYIPRENRNGIFVKGLDGNLFGLRQPEYFDFVLADVPCSGERHLLENHKEFESWTEKRTKNLSVRQYSLLSSAWLACKSGGRIVYSTCSISPEENDRVIEKLTKKRTPKFIRPEFKNLSFIEKTEFGFQILPDRCGFGPMYFSIIEKTSS